MDPTMEQILTTRECEVLELVAKGCKNREIALALEIEECTVHFHTKNIIAKLGVKNRAAAVYRAVKNGWIT